MHVIHCRFGLRGSEITFLETRLLSLVLYIVIFIESLLQLMRMAPEIPFIVEKAVSED